MQEGLLTMTAYDLLYLVDTISRIIMMSSITILVLYLIRYTRMKKYLWLIQEYNKGTK